MESPLLTKSKQFALDIIKVCNKVKSEKREIELLIESGYYDDKTILENCIELKKILVSSINTAKKNNN